METKNPFRFENGEHSYIIGTEQGPYGKYCYLQRGSSGILYYVIIDGKVIKTRNLWMASLDEDNKPQKGILIEGSKWEDHREYHGLPVYTFIEQEGLLPEEEAQKWIEKTEERAKRLFDEMIILRDAEKDIPLCHRTFMKNYYRENLGIMHVCECLYPATIKKVKKNNHNHGKEFYACSKGKSHYFEWVNDDDQKLNSAIHNAKHGFLFGGDRKRLEKLGTKTLLKQIFPRKGPY